MTDVSLTIPLGGPETKLTVGKTKEDLRLRDGRRRCQPAAPGACAQPVLRLAQHRVKLTRVLGKDHRMTASGGVFNDWWVNGDPFSDSGTDVTARVTGLAWAPEDTTRYLHLGVAGRYAGADHDTLRYRGRPESNVTDNYVDTGALSGDHAWHTGLEALWAEGPFSVFGEYTHAWVSAPGAGNPRFDGYYIAGSWVLTGEARPYDRTVGYARRVMPRGRWGAPELVARFSHVDLDDGVVRGVRSTRRISASTGGRRGDGSSASAGAIPGSTASTGPA